MSPDRPDPAPAADGDAPPDAHPHLRALRARYLSAQLRGDRREALRLVLEEGLGRGVAAPELHLGVIQPAQYEIGRLWQENEISVAQEHLATAISQLAVAHLYRELPREGRVGKLVVVACAPGEHHELGARIAADFLEMAGFDVHFLGADVPADGLARMVRAERPDLVVLSASTTLCFPGLREALAEVKEAAGDAPILVGGGAFRWSPDCPLPAGILHAGKDARALVAVARELLAA